MDWRFNSTCYCVEYGALIQVGARLPWFLAVPRIIRSMPPIDGYEDRMVHFVRIEMGSISPEYTVYIPPEIRKFARPRIFPQPGVANGVSGLESPTQTEQSWNHCTLPLPTSPLLKGWGNVTHVPGWEGGTIHKEWLWIRDLKCFLSTQLYPTMPNWYKYRIFCVVLELTNCIPLDTVSPLVLNPKLIVTCLQQTMVVLQRSYLHSVKRS